MADIGQLLDKLEANLTSFYDKAEEKGIVIDGARNTENLVLVAEQIGSSGGGVRNLLKDSIYIDFALVDTSVESFYVGDYLLGLKDGASYKIRYKLDGQEFEYTRTAFAEVWEGIEYIDFPISINDDYDQFSIKDGLNALNIKDENTGLDYTYVKDNKFVIPITLLAQNGIFFGNKSFELLSISKVEEDVITDLYEFSSTNEMEAFKSAENVGKYAKYVGETTDTYTNGAIYFVVEEGGNIVLLNKDNYVVTDGTCLAVFSTPLSIPEGIVGGDTVKVYFSIDGGAEQSADCIITDAGSFRYIDNAEGSGMVTLLDNDDATYMVAGYLDMNPFAGEAGQAYMGMAMLKEGTSLPSDYIPSINLLYIAKEVEGEETLYIKSEIYYTFNKYVYLQSSGFALATDKDIRANYVAYNSDGNIITGSLMNPERITSQEQYEEILSNDNGDNQYVYRIDIEVGNFLSSHGVTAKKYAFDGQRWLSPVYSLEEIGNENDIGWGNKKLELNSNSYARPYAFAYCSTLQTVDFINPNNFALYIAHHLFYGCSQLTKVIFRDSSVLDSSSDKTGIFDETPISQGVGYIYVPDTYVENFKQNQYFAPYANQIKPLSEYVEE